ncbi:unnamed protein product [Calicophoron daubneyi]|uniref:Uncharacterized protein n=1 Tax=Calicophoron daubneyi TaxID=300641 RepID=A0AAV2T185_CALDB
MLKSVRVLALSKRAFGLPFHKVNVAPKIMVFPASVWAFFTYRKREHERLEREKVEGRRFYEHYPRDLRPFPFGDGKTPFFASMCKYWGFQPKDHGEHE